MTRVMLTGGAGFVGSHCVADWVRHTDWRLVVVDSMHHKGRRERLEEFQGDGRVEVIQADLANEMWTSHFAKHVPPCDVIVNMASDSHVDRSISYPGDTWLNNTRLAYTVLELARRWQDRLTHFIQMSTDEVYGPARDGTLHEEWDRVLPSNPYAASKAAQEALAISYWRTYKVPVVLINSMNLIGERQDAEKFLPLCVGRALRGEIIHVHGEPHARGGGQRIGSRFYTHAVNLASALRFLVQRDRPAAFGDTEKPDRWHVVGEREVCNLSLAKLVGSALGVPVRCEVVDYHSARPGHDLRYALSGAKLHAAGWRHELLFGQAVERTVRWYAANPDWLRPH